MTVAERRMTEHLTWCVQAAASELAKAKQPETKAFWRGYMQAFSVAADAVANGVMRHDSTKPAVATLEPDASWTRVEGRP